MKYTINRTNYNDFSVFEINKLEGRGYAIPYSSIETLKKIQQEAEETFITSNDDVTTASNN